MDRRIFTSPLFVLGYLVLSSGVLCGAEFKVNTAIALQNALTAAQSNGEDDVIMVAQGTYARNFTYSSTEGKSITLLGGYTIDFASRVFDPSNTVLYGMTAATVLLIKNENNGGDIYIEGFTVRKVTNPSGGVSGPGIYAFSSSVSPNPSGSGKITLTGNIITQNPTEGLYIYGGGAYAESSSDSGPARDVVVTRNFITDNSAYDGGGIYADSLSNSSDPAGNVIFYNNFISGNTARNSGGGVNAYSSNYSSGPAGNVTFANNIISVNTADDDGGGVLVSSQAVSGPSGVVTFDNNAIAINTAANYAGGAYIYDNGGTVLVYNSIIWGNQAAYGKDLDLDGAATTFNGYNNDFSDVYGVAWTNSGGNIDADPQFVGGGDCHLKSSSPCIDKGTNIAPGILPIDFDGQKRITDGNNDGTATVDIGADEFLSKDDFLGTWDGQGVFYRNSESGQWTKVASPADMIASGDLDGDGKVDLIGTWSGQAGVWIRYSKTGAWTKISTMAKHIASGDMNGDGRVDLLGTWDGQGVYYRDSKSGIWVKLASPATLLTAGDLDGDGIDDLIGVWPTQGGVWVKYGKSGTWSKLSSTARDIATGDMNGDQRDDLVGTWDGQGVYFRESRCGFWIKMAAPAEQVTAGDLDGDGIDDLIGIWPGQEGDWVKYSKTATWSKLSSTAKDIATGLMRGGVWGSSRFGFVRLQGPFGGYAEGPGSLSRYKNLSSEGPGGWRFAAQEEKNLIPQTTGKTPAIPGPGQPGFTWVEQKNLIPQEQERAIKEKRQKAETRDNKKNKPK